jgi:hypothetical protein
MESITHFIESYSTKSGSHEICMNSFPMHISSLDAVLESTSKSEFLKTVAIFKIKFKPSL